MTKAYGVVCSKTIKIRCINLTEMQAIYLVIVLRPPILIALRLIFFLLYLQIFHQNIRVKFCIYAGAALNTAYYISLEIAIRSIFNVFFQFPIFNFDFLYFF